MCDVEVGRDISSHPGVVYPEKLEMFGSLSHGRGCGGGQDVHPALAGVRKLHVSRHRGEGTLKFWKTL